MKKKKQKKVRRPSYRSIAKWQPTQRDRHVLEVYKGFVKSTPAQSTQNREVVNIQLPPILEDDVCVQAPEQLPENTPPRTIWKFGMLVDEEARQELLRFGETFDRSQNSQTVFVGHTPEND